MFHVYRRTQDPELRDFNFVYGAFTLYREPFQVLRLSKSLVTQMFSPTTPMSKLIGLGCSPFARRY